MAIYNNYAYDLDFYADEEIVVIPRKQNKKSVVIKHKKMKKLAIRKFISSFVVIMKTAIILSGIINLIGLNAKITNLTYDINSYDSQIVELNSELDYYKNQMIMSTRLEDIENFALTKGMVKSSSAQVKYVELEQENKIEINPSKMENNLMFLSTATYNFLNTLLH